MAVEALPADGWEGAGQVDGLQHALFQALQGQAQRPVTLVEFPLPLLFFPLALDQGGLTPAGLPLPLVGQGLALPGEAVALISGTCAGRRGCALS